MTRQQVLDNYNVDKNGIIRSPGKFEGEPCFVPALWEIGLEGFADSDNGSVYGFRIPKDDQLRLEFPELNRWLGRKRSVKIGQSDSGFVYAF